MNHSGPWLRRCVLLAAGAVLGGVAPAYGQVPRTPRVLDTQSYWRVRTVWETEELVLADGQVAHARVRQTVGSGTDVHAWFRANPKVGSLPPNLYTIDRIEPEKVIRLPGRTPADWMDPDFDDSTWARQRGPILNDTIDANWKLLLLRGSFEVTDPEWAGRLTLSLGFRGGAVVYVNGVEVGRAFMPQGKLDLYTPALPYPEETYFAADGYAMTRNSRDPKDRERIEQRVRRLDKLNIPPQRLRKGVNVLAVAIVRSPTLARFYVSRNRGGVSLHNDCLWGRIGLFDLELNFQPGAAVTPNTAPLPGRGFQVWNHSVVRTVFPEDFPDPFVPLGPVRISAVRNGTFSGQFVVGDEDPIRGLKATPTALTGPAGTIPVQAVRLRYGRADGSPSPRGKHGAFDTLDDAPPDPVPLFDNPAGSIQADGAAQLGAAAIQPVWINVTVPPDAKPGTYSGTITVTTQDASPVAVPLEVRVIDWTLPDHRRFAVHMDIVQSPESVALAYGAEMWSQRHLALLDRTFALLGPLATKTLYITAIRRTHWGNEHAMVRWFRDDQGELQPDFSVVEKYLDVATRHLGPVPGVVLYCWEPLNAPAGEHAGQAGTAARSNDKPILYTLVDPDTGELFERNGPAWGTAEAKEFWQKFNEGIAAVLKKRGMENSILYGLIGDVRPTQQAMDDIVTGAVNPRWAAHSHYYVEDWHTHSVGMTVALWGVGVSPVDPLSGYSFGWANPSWVAYYPREMNIRSTLVDHRVKIEVWHGAKRGRSAFISTGPESRAPRGLGRLGADFWPVLGSGRRRASLAGRYPEAAWGQLNLNYGIPRLLGVGRDGPVPTVRSEAFRENIQELEARILIEKALFDDQAETLLGDDLIRRCRAALDERIRIARNANSGDQSGRRGEGEPWYISSDWNTRAELVFSLAGEVAAKLGREPQPNLERQWAAPEPGQTPVDEPEADEGPAPGPQAD